MSAINISKLVICFSCTFEISIYTLCKHKKEILKQ